MVKWVVIIVSGICFSLSSYMSMLAFRSGDSGAFLFAGFGLLSGAFFIVSIIRILVEKGIYKRTINSKISRNREPASFVPHWFIMSALIATAIAVLAAIVAPLFFKGN